MGTGNSMPGWAKGVIAVTATAAIVITSWKIYAHIKAKKAAAADPLNKMSGLQPNTWSDEAKKGAPKTSFLDNAVAVKLASQIHDAIGWGWSPDQDVIVAAIRGLKNQLQLSQVTFAYNDMFKEDLLTDLVKNLSDKNMNTVRQIMNSFPK